MNNRPQVRLEFYRPNANSQLIQVLLQYMESY
nr:MAG TPA: hypothetical protein [Caudoviricetes sp.]